MQASPSPFEFSLSFKKRALRRKTAGALGWLFEN